LETAKATLETARAEAEEEIDRMKVLDGKLSNVAAFSGVSLSVSGALGANVIASGRLEGSFEVAIGIALAAAVALLLAGVVSCFHGLTPKDFSGITPAAAAERVWPSSLRREPSEALAKIASTYATDILPQARWTNKKKVAATKRAFWLVGLGLAANVATLGLIVIASTAV
jgi:hypothetical protein